MIMMIKKIVHIITGRLSVKVKYAHPVYLIVNARQNSWISLHLINIFGVFIVTAESILARVSNGIDNL